MFFFGVWTAAAGAAGAAGGLSGGFSLVLTAVELDVEGRVREFVLDGGAARSLEYSLYFAAVCRFSNQIPLLQD